MAPNSIPRKKEHFFNADSSAIHKFYISDFSGKVFANMVLALTKKLYRTKRECYKIPSIKAKTQNFFKVTNYTNELDIEVSNQTLNQ